MLAPEEKSAADYFEESLRLTTIAEELGFQHVQMVEHHLSPYGGYSPDPVTFLAAAAMRTTRMRLITGAVVPAFTHPVQLAGKLAMLDNLSRGRLSVGFGRAFLPEEFDTFGISMDESRGRFAEGVQACQRLWSEEGVEWQGQFWRFGPVTLLPRPLQRPHPPIFVASATNPESCAAAGRAGHHLQVVPTVTSRERLQEMLAAYRSSWFSPGRAPSGEIQVKYTCYVGEDRREVLSTAERFERNYVAKMSDAVASWAHRTSSSYPGYEQFVDKVAKYDFGQSLRDNKVLAGTPAEVSSQIETILGWFGSDIALTLQFNPGFMPFAVSERAIRLFADHVKPRFEAPVPVADR